MAGKSVFGTRPPEESEPKDFYLGWTDGSGWQQRGPMTRSEAVRSSAALIRSGLAPFFHSAPLGPTWHPVGKLLPGE
ncbi:MAG: hypothetical protein U1A78_33710 [Polyangia bacterium]